jgi:hypothetical protein
MKPTFNSMNRLEEELRRTRPCAAPPADLHRSIMRAVRTAADESERASPSPLWRWMIAPALAVMAAALWLIWPQPEKGALLSNAAQVALDRAHAVPQQASAVVLSPLSDELECLNRDVQKTVDFLLASVP